MLRFSLYPNQPRSGCRIPTVTVSVHIPAPTEKCHWERSLERGHDVYRNTRTASSQHLVDWGAAGSWPSYISFAYIYLR